VPRTFPDLEVTNTGQPQVVQISPHTRSANPMLLAIQLAAAQTVSISPVSV
jgi:hypothetical protein